MANCAPTELSKKPPEEAFLGAPRLLAVLLGSSIFLVANWAPTELSKNPFDAPASHVPSESADLCQMCAVFQMINTKNSMYAEV